MKRILSGIQPSGALHLGNYLGMMQPAVELQDQGEALYFIADLHALTSLHDADALRRYSRDVALDFLACGLDPAHVEDVLRRGAEHANQLAVAVMARVKTAVGLA